MTDITEDIVTGLMMFMELWRSEFTERQTQLVEFAAKHYTGYANTFKNAVTISLQATCDINYPDQDIVMMTSSEVDDVVMRGYVKNSRVGGWLCSWQRVVLLWIWYWGLIVYE